MGNILFLGVFLCVAITMNIQACTNRLTDRRTIEETRKENSKNEHEYNKDDIHSFIQLSFCSGVVYISTCG